MRAKSEFWVTEGVQGDKFVKMIKGSIVSPTSKKENSISESG